MTFHDPASIESGCVNTRGRNHEIHKREMYFNKFLFWVTVLGLETICSAVPDDVSNFNMTTINLPINISTNTANNETLSIINNTVINTVKFLDVPKHTSTTLGKSVLLECRTSEPVIDCQWSWRPLPPVHLPLPDINPMETINDTSTTVIDTVSQTQSLPVRLFPAFGNNNNDCSVRFTDTQHEQMGYWTCAARKSIDQLFVSTEPAMLSIIEKPVSVTFVKTENATEAPGGSSAEIICRTEKTVKECQWSWRMFNQSEIWNLEVKKFPSFGIDNTDCSLKFKNVLAEQEGLWTCGARINQNDIFIKTKPIRFLVSEVEFVQLSSGIQTSVGESALLKCLVDKPVIQCEWSWKPINSTREPTVIKKFIPNSDNEHDCSVRFKNVLYEEEGLWTCGVRLTTSGHLHEAPPAKLTLLPSGKLSFVEISENKTALVNTPETLKCLLNGKVDTCTWLWRPLTGDTEATIAREFTPTTSKNCSLDFTHIQIENQGYWSCRITVTSSNTVLTSPSIKLIVSDDQEKIEFSELSQDIQISSGGSVSLRCVTTLSVEQCRWSLTPVNSNTTVVVKQFPAVGPEARDCSVRLSHALAEQEGLWTCGAKIHGKENYTNASPAKLSLLEPGTIDS